MTTSPSPSTASEDQRVSSLSLGVAAFSTIVEWYDFTLYLYMATLLGDVFFGGGEGGILAALLGFAVSYVMRPVGALVFGHIGDRYGRRRMMMLSMALMSVAMLLTALLPTHAMIGAAAGWLMLALRLLMAFSVGGEYTGVVAYLAEGAAPKRRGLVASLAAAASEVGALLASLVNTITLLLLPLDAVKDWGWRIPFVVGALMAGGVLLARSTMDESPEFEAAVADGTTSTNPVGDTVRDHKAAIARTFAISALGSITYYVGITYVPTFLHSVAGFAESDASWLATLAGIAVIAITPLAGLAADRFGRRPALVVNAVVAAIIPVVMFMFMGQTTHTGALVAAVLCAFVAGGVSAIAASATPEQFPATGRLSGLALGVTMATAIFGGLTPLVAQWLTKVTGWPGVPGAMIAVVALAVLPVLWRMPETAPTKVDESQW